MEKHKVMVKRRIYENVDTKENKFFTKNSFDHEEGNAMIIRIILNPCK